jgi:hypothetical protein
VQHFMGCQTCNALNRNGDLDACREGMFHSFDFTSRYQAPMLRNARPRSEADKSQLRELAYCSNNPTAHGCMGAKPVDAERQMQVEMVSLPIRCSQTPSLQDQSLPCHGRLLLRLGDLSHITRLAWWTPLHGDAALSRTDAS